MTIKSASSRSCSRRSTDPLSTAEAVHYQLNVEFPTFIVDARAVSTLRADVMVTVGIASCILLLVGHTGPHTEGKYRVPCTAASRLGSFSRMIACPQTPAQPLPVRPSGVLALPLPHRNRGHLESGIFAGSAGCASDPLQKLSLLTAKPYSARQRMLSVAWLFLPMLSRYSPDDS